MDANSNQMNNLQNPIQNSAPKKDGTAGPIIGSIIIILLIIMGGLYFWGSIIEKQKDNQPVVTPAPESTDVNSIEADLNATEVNNLDADLDAIDAEIDAELQ